MEYINKVKEFFEKDKRRLIILIIPTGSFGICSLFPMIGLIGNATRDHAGDYLTARTEIMISLKNDYTAISFNDEDVMQTVYDLTSEYYKKVDGINCKKVDEEFRSECSSIQQKLKDAKSDGDKCLKEWNKMLNNHKEEDFDDIDMTDEEEESLEICMDFSKNLQVIKELLD